MPPALHSLSNSSASLSRSDAVRRKLLLGMAASAARTDGISAAVDGGAAESVAADVGTAGAFLCRSDFGSFNDANAARSAAGGIAGGGVGGSSSSNGTLR